MADGLTNYISNPADSILSSLTAQAGQGNTFTAPLAPNAESRTFSSSFDSGYNHDLAGYV